MAGIRSDDWCAHGKPETTYPASVAVLNSASKTKRKFSSHKRIDDNNLFIGETNISYRQNSSGLPIRLSPLGKKTGGDSASQRRAITTNSGARSKRSPKTQIRVRPSTTARAQWRMKIDDPLHVNKRLETGKIQFKSHLSTTESVILFDSNETSEINDILLQTGGSGGFGYGNLDHNQQAHKLLQQARKLVKQQTSVTIDNNMKINSTSKTNLDSISKCRQVASIHHAVLRFMSQSSCCTSHSALLTDAATFFRTQFIDNIVAVKKEREILKKQTDVEIEKSKLKLQQIKDRATKHREIMRKIIERNTRRAIQVLTATIFGGWKTETISNKKTRSRKGRSRAIACQALVRRGLRRNTSQIFVSWRTFAVNNIQRRRLIENEEMFKYDLKCKKKEMDEKLKLMENERNMYKNETEELRGLIEVLSRSISSTSDKLELSMKKCKQINVADEVTKQDEPEDTPKQLTPRSLLKREVGSLAMHLNQVIKKIVDSGKYKIISSELIVKESVETQTKISSLNESKEQDTQTNINFDTMKEMENSIKKYQMENAKIAASMARVKAEAAAKLEAVKAAAEKAAAEKAAAENQATSISVINTSSQTRLTMDNISRTFDKLSIVQEKYDSLLKKSKKNASETKKVETIIDAAVNIVGDAIFDDALDEAALSLPNTGEKEKVIDRDTLRKRKQIKVFLNKVKLDAAHDFNDKDIEDMVSLLDIHGVAPGDDIITQGEKATWLGMLLSGELDVIVNGVGKVATMKAGALLGEISFLGGSLERTASVKTKISGIVAAIPFRRIVELQDTDAGLYRKLMLLIAEAGIVKLFSAESRLKGQIAALKTQLSGLNARDESNVKKVEEKKVEQKENSSHSDTDSDYGSESGSHSSDRGSDLSSLEYHPGKHKRRKKKRGSILGQKRKKKSHKFLLSSNNEVFYRTKVAQAEKNLEEMQHELDKEEREMKRLRAKVKGEELQRKHLEKEMEFMQMKLAAAGLLD